MIERLTDRPARVLALFVALSFALYANAIPGEFVFDDNLTVATTWQIRSLETLPDVFKTYRPVRYLSFALDHAISGERPWAYHVLNSVYHGVVATLVFLVLRRFSGDARVALAGALLFAVHPVHTECVAYISGRRDLLTTLFYLAALLAYFRYGDGGRIVWLGASIASFVLALGAKEMAATLPAAIVLHDMLTLDRAAMRRRLPAYAAFLVLAGAGAALAVTGGATNQKEFHGGSAAVNFLTVAALHAHYAQLLVAPVTLVADYSFETFPLVRSPLEPAAIAGLAFVAVSLAIAAIYRRRAPLVSLGIAWFFLTLLPVSHIVPFHELAAQHYLYLPSVGFCLLAGLAVERLRAAAGGRVAYVALAAVLVAFSARTVVRNPDWRDAETLWRATTASAPRCARAHLNLGMALARRGALDEAAVEVEAAIRILPDYVYARVKLAQIHRERGREADAVAELEEALRVARSLERSPVPPGEICLALGRFVEGLQHYEAALARNPRNVRALVGLGRCHEALGNDRTALRVYERAVALAPDRPDVLRLAAAMAQRCSEFARASELRARAEKAAARRAPRPAPSYPSSP